jgi:hypothetical protein
LPIEDATVTLVLRYFQWGSDSFSPKGLRKLAGGATPELSTQLFYYFAGHTGLVQTELRADGVATPLEIAKNPKSVRFLPWLNELRHKPKN